jgi:hypothetical protein
VNNEGCPFPVLTTRPLSEIGLTATAKRRSFDRAIRWQRAIPHSSGITTSFAKTLSDRSHKFARGCQPPFASSPPALRTQRIAPIASAIIDAPEALNGQKFD